MRFQQVIVIFHDPLLCLTAVNSHRRCLVRITSQNQRLLAGSCEYGLSRTWLAEQHHIDEVVIRRHRHDGFRSCHSCPPIEWARTALADDPDPYQPNDPTLLLAASL